MIQVFFSFPSDEFVNQAEVVDLNADVMSQLLKLEVKSINKEFGIELHSHKHKVVIGDNN